VKNQTPEKSYVVWHTQRTGSTLLCTALERMGIAGKPDEWPEDLAVQVNGSLNAAKLIRDDLWSNQTSKNGVFGVKFSFYEPTIRSFFGAYGLKDKQGHINKKNAWDTVFPNCKHIVMTRRNKIRLAVSWWKSINGGPGHLSQQGRPLPWQEIIPTAPDDLESRFDYDSINTLILECIRREAALQDLLEDLEVTPLTITYEDFVSDYEGTVGRALDHIGLDVDIADVPTPLLKRTSDVINEKWVQMFLSQLDTV
jgi:LPS sulfotransferase NodH